MLLVRIEREPQFVMYLSIFVVQLLNCVRLFVTSWAAARQASWDLHYLLEFAQTCPLSQWCQPPKSSSVVLFSFCPQSFRASGSFPMIGLFTSGGQNIGASGSASVLPMNIQGWFHEFTLRNLICQWMIYLWKCHFLKIFFGGEAVTDKEETIKGFNDWVTWLGWCFRGIAQTRLNECEW